MDELQVKLTTLSQQNARLVQHATGLEQQRQLLASQVCGGVAGGWGGWGSRRTRGGDIVSGLCVGGCRGAMGRRCD